MPERDEGGQQLALRYGRAPACADRREHGPLERPGPIERRRDAHAQPANVVLRVARDPGERTVVPLRPLRQHGCLSVPRRRDQRDDRAGRGRPQPVDERRPRDAGVRRRRDLAPDRVERRHRFGAVGGHGRRPSCASPRPSRARGSDNDACTEIAGGAHTTRMPARLRAGELSDVGRRRGLLAARKTSVAFTRLLTSSASERSSLRKIELMCFSTARLVRTSDSAIACCSSLGDLGEHLALARCELGERRALGARLRAPRAPPRSSGRSTEPPYGDRRDRGDELGAVVHALLEQIAAAVRAPSEQRERVARLRVLAEDEDADLRVGLPQERRDPGFPRRSS